MIKNLICIKLPHLFYHQDTKPEKKTHETELTMFAILIYYFFMDFQTQFP